MVYEGERWSFAEVMREVDALAAALVEDHGIAKGDRVGIAMRNLPEWIVSFAAITSIGAISVSFNAWWVTEEIDFAIGDCEPSLMLVDAERAGRAAQPCAARGVPMVVARPEPGQDLPGGAAPWSEVVVPGRSMPVVDIDGEDDATILYTSGTTGHPKGAVSTHRAVCQALFGFNCRAAAEAAREPSGERGGGPAEPAPPPSFILVLPLFHVTGCVPVMLGAFAAGLKLVMMYRWEPRRALELIEAERVTQFVGVPTQAWDLLEHPEFGSFDTSSLSRVGGGGAPAAPRLVRRMGESFTGGSPTIGYGMTETNAYGPQNVGRDYLTHPMSTGRATPIAGVEIRSESGATVPVGSLGEIWMSGPHLFRGYWNDPEATRETLVGGWIRTGDLGRLDEDGYLYVTDRQGTWCCGGGGEHLTARRSRRPSTSTPRCTRWRSSAYPTNGEQVAAAVMLGGCELDAAGLRTTSPEHLSAFKIPTQVSFTHEPLPLNAAGKILKRMLREDLAEQVASGTAQ
ncbi:MAG: class I adenylate-forming enzyme family protein [Microthrixaceae bacterium]